MINSNDTVKTRIVIPSLLWIPIALALIARFYVIQIEKHEYYQTAADKSCTAQRKLEGRWGEICDRDGYLLVGNRPCVRISCSPHELKPEKRKIAAELLNRHLGKSFEHYYQKLSPTRRSVKTPDKEVPNRYQMLGREVPLDVAHKLREELRENKIPLTLFSFENTYTRIYPKKRMLANFIGYSNLENDELKPQAGIEKGMSGNTAPQAGKIKMEISRDGIPLDYGLQNINASRDGKNVYLTISEPIQSILEEELDAAWEKWRPDAIYAAIASPDGNILAIAQRPTFDPSDRSTFSNDTLRNRMIMDGFEPGSVMKPFTVAKALDWGFVNPGTRIDCEGGRWVYAGKPMTDTHHNEKLTVHEIIQKSSNIGTAKIALMFGEKRLEQALSGFGFGSRTGIPLPYESTGSKPRPPKNDKLAITRIPIGYAINVTALQLLRAYCTLANGGRCPKLRLIDRIEDPATGKSEPEPVEDAVQVISRPEALKELIAMMITVTQKGGTAVQAAIPGYDVAGKTGTSHKQIFEYGEPKPGKPRRPIRIHYSPNQYYASFAGFVPATSPRIVMVITVDNPRGAKFGGTVSGPIFSKTAKRVLEHLNVPPDHPDELLPAKPKRRVAEARPTAPAARPKQVSRPAPVKPSARVAPTKTVRKTAAKPVRETRPAATTTRRNSTAKPRYSGKSTAKSDLPPMTRTWDEERWP